MKHEWETEPNIKVFEAHGYKCLVARTETYGNLNGYVGVRRGHPLYGASYSSPLGFIFKMLLEEYEKHHPHKGTRDVVIEFACLNMDNSYEFSPCSILSVHGGITWDGYITDLFAKEKYNLEADDLWYFGFDTAHSGDLAPEYPNLPRITFGSPEGRGNTYKNMRYVSRECTSLAKQFEELVEELKTGKTKKLLEKVHEYGRKIRGI